MRYKKRYKKLLQKALQTALQKALQTAVQVQLTGIKSVLYFFVLRLDIKSLQCLWIWMGWMDGTGYEKCPSIFFIL